MKRILCAALLGALAQGALAADVGVSISIGDPNFYGRLDIGNFPRPVLMYPQPTIVNKVVFVSMNERAKALGELLGNDAELQSVAVEYGFRTADTERFVNTVKATGLAVEPRVTQVVDPPSFEIMAEMIDVVAKEMSQ